MVNTYNAYINKINSVRYYMLSFVEENKYSSPHHECGKSRRLKDEKAVQDINATIDEWDCDPWDLRCTNRFNTSDTLVSHFESTFLMMDLNCQILSYKQGYVLQNLFF